MLSLLRIGYRLGVQLYGKAIYIASFFNPKAKQWVSGRTNWAKNLKDTVAKLPTSNSKRVWVHAASTGEFEQVKPVIESLKKNNPDCSVIVSFFSPSGYDSAIKYPHKDIACYLPLDSPSNAKNFIDILSPDFVIWVKYEYWWYFLSRIHQLKIPLILISAIFQQRQPFFKWYGTLHRKMLSYFTQLFVQNSDSLKLLKTVGYSNKVTVSGDTRFDRVTQIANRWQPIPIIENWLQNETNVLVAGSTWPDDEKVMKHFAINHTKYKCIIVPHHIDSQSIENTMQLFPGAIKYSQLVNGHAAESHILIVDTMGMLSKIYKYARVTFIGGAFSSTGLHNTLEAAVYGKPVLFGPDYNRFAEAIGLAECGGAFPVEDVREWEKVVNQLFTDDKFWSQAATNSKNYVAQHAGATQIILDFLYKNRLLTN